MKKKRCIVSIYSVNNSPNKSGFTICTRKASLLVQLFLGESQRGAGLRVQAVFTKLYLAIAVCL